MEDGVLEVNDMGPKKIQNKLGPPEILLEVATLMGSVGKCSGLGMTLLQHAPLKYALVHGMVDWSICTPKMT